MCISREQEEFLAAYRTDEARQAFIDSYGKEKVNFLDGGYGENRNFDGYPNVLQPYDYEIEYIETSIDYGLAYIDTGLNITDPNSELSGKIQIIAVNDVRDGCFLGSGIAHYYHFGGYINYFNINSISLRSICTNTPAFFFNIPTGSFINYIISPKNRFFECNGIRINMDSFSDTIIERPLNLFMDVEPFSTFRYFNFKAVVGDSVVMDMIPVSKDNVGYMYDKVSKKLFGAQGVGRFILGPMK